MCLAIPACVVQILDPTNALVDVGGVKKKISTALIEDVKVGDYLIVHVGFALSRLDPSEAQKTLEIFKEMEKIWAEEVI